MRYGLFILIACVIIRQRKKLSDKRKNKLLRLAEKYNFIIIEDDDFEFSILKEKTDSLFRKSSGNRVIYIGAFGKFLNSSFQMSFLIAPIDVLDEAKKYLNVLVEPILCWKMQCYKFLSMVVNPY